MENVEQRKNVVGKIVVVNDIEYIYVSEVDKWFNIDGGYEILCPGPDKE